MPKYTFSDELYSDLHKDAYGFRPREGDYLKWKEASDDEKQVMWDSMCKTLEDNFAAEKEDQQRCISEFEQLIASTMSGGAGTRETALRWIMDGSICNGDWEFLEYEYGLPYNYLKNAA